MRNKMQKWEYMMINMLMYMKPLTVQVISQNEIKIWNDYDKKPAEWPVIKDDKENLESRIFQFTFILLDAYGKEGWEICGFIERSQNYYWTLKRPLLESTTG